MAAEPVTIWENEEAKGLAQMCIRDSLQVEEKAGRLIDRRAAEAAIFERARAERDAHLAWCSRIAPLIATETGCNLAPLFASLDREMRTHLDELATLSIEDLLNA